MLEGNNFNVLENFSLVGPVNDLHSGSNGESVVALTRSEIALINTVDNSVIARVTDDDRIFPLTGIPKGALSVDGDKYYLIN